MRHYTRTELDNKIKLVLFEDRSVPFCEAQIGSCAGDCAGRRQARHAEREVNDVVQHRYLEDAEQMGPGLMAGPGEGAVVGGDARDETEDADEKEQRAERPRGDLDGGLAGVEDVGCHGFGLTRGGGETNCGAGSSDPAPQFV